MPGDERIDGILRQIIPCLQDHQDRQRGQGFPNPFVVGLTGLQGCGKSTLAAELVKALNKLHHRTIDISLDDFYKTNADRLELCKTYSCNSLLQFRGQPGTHDIALAEWFFTQFSDSLSHVAEVTLPVFNKALCAGNGDRLPVSEWRSCIRSPPIEVIIFEGWCIGFRPLPEHVVQEKWSAAKDKMFAAHAQALNSDNPTVGSRYPTSTIADHCLENLLFVNSQLEEYCRRFMGPQYFDFLVHLDTMDLENVYAWRIEQEHSLRKHKGGGMTDDQIVQFVQIYMPAYELYLDDLRAGFFTPSMDTVKTQLHVVLDKYRTVVDMVSVSS